MSLPEPPVPTRLARNRAERRAAERQRRRRKGLAAVTGASVAISGFGVVTASPAGAETFTVTSGGDLVDEEDGETTLREAVLEANATPGDDTITFSPGVTTVEVAGGYILVTEGVTIEGPGSELLTIQADGIDEPNGYQPLFAVFDAGAVVVSGVTIEGFGSDDESWATDGGALISARTDLTLQDVTMSGNAGARGGALAFEGYDWTCLEYDAEFYCIDELVTTNDLVIEDSTFEENVAYGGGAAARIKTAGAVEIRDTTFTGNVAVDLGGALDLRLEPGASVAITGSRFEQNVSLDQAGGAIAIGAEASDITIDGTEFVGNVGENGGGAIALSEYDPSDEHPLTLTITGSTLTGNHAGALDGDGDPASYEYGGALQFRMSGVLTIDGTTFEGNTASKGGALYGEISGDGEVVISGSTLLENRAYYVEEYDGNVYRLGYGGAVLLDVRDEASVHLEGSVVAGNVAGQAGGGLAVELEDEAFLRVANSTIDQNRVTADTDAEGASSASGDGGGILLDTRAWATARFVDSTISRNEAEGGSGGGLSLTHGGESYGVGLAIVGTTISGNEAGVDGGGIQALRDADVAIAHTTITDNVAGGAGGGIQARSRTSAIGSFGPEVALSHTIVSGNQAGDDGTDDLSRYDEVLSEELTDPASITAVWSLVGDAGDTEIVDGEDGNIVGEDPELGALADNGGAPQGADGDHVGWTHLPPTDSPVVDAGDEDIEDAPELDQRGEDRIDGVIDLGSVEAGTRAASTPGGSSPAPTPTTTTVPTTPTTPSTPPPPPVQRGGGSPVFVTPGGQAVVVPLPPNAPAQQVTSSVAVSPTESIAVSGDGKVFSTNPAHDFGDIPEGIDLQAPIVGLGVHWTLQETADAAAGYAAAAQQWVPSGYWLLGADGGVFSFGTATFFGSTGAMKLNKPVVAITPTSTGDGYWLVAADGGVFSFGDATFYGSTGNLKLAKPIVSMLPTSTGKGYWLIGADGGVFTFGDATFHGSAATTGKTFTGAVRSASGSGYVLLDTSGAQHPFGP